MKKTTDGSVRHKTKFEAVMNSTKVEVKLAEWNEILTWLGRALQDSRAASSIPA